MFGYIDEETGNTINRMMVFRAEKLINPGNKEVRISNSNVCEFMYKGEIDQ